MKTAIYPGSFDPVTYGHIDIIKRASKLFDRLIIGVLINKAKTPLFSADERVNMIKAVTADIPNVEVLCYDGLMVDFAKQCGVTAVVRGLRAVTDFEYELQMAQMNSALYDDIETVFLTTSTEYAYLSSSNVREVAAFGGDISRFVPPYVADMTMDKFKDNYME